MLTRSCHFTKKKGIAILSPIQDDPIYMMWPVNDHIMVNAPHLTSAKVDGRTIQWAGISAHPPFHESELN